MSEDTRVAASNMCSNNNKQKRIRTQKAPQKRYNLRSYGRGDPVAIPLNPILNPEPQPSCSTSVAPDVQQAASTRDEEVDRKGETSERIRVPHRLHRKRNRLSVAEDKQGEEDRLIKKSKVTIQQLRDSLSIVPGYVVERPEISPAMHQALKRHILRDRGKKRQDLPPWAEQLRRTDALQPGDEHERRYKERIDELLTTKTQQKHRIDELVTTQTHQQQQQHRLQQRVDELLSEREEQRRQIDTLQERNQELQDSLNCSICLTSDHQKIVFSCGHSACHMCSHVIGRCHMCRDPITDVFPLYL